VKAKTNQPYLDLDFILKTQAGRRFAWRLISPVESDPMKLETNMTYYALGVQATARALEREIITQHPEWYRLMVSERYNGDEEKTCVTSECE
jgi:hypothetical protein